MNFKVKLSLLILSSFAFLSFAFQDSEDVYILYTSNINGVLRDCGCGEEKMGGFARLFTVIENFRNEHKNVYLIDTGDHLPSYKYPSKSKMILQLMDELNYDFILKGDQDYLSGNLATEGFYHNNSELYNFILPNSAFDDLGLKLTGHSKITGSPFLIFHGDSTEFASSNELNSDAKFVFLAHSQEMHQSQINGKHLFQAGLDTEYLGVLKLEKKNNSYHYIENNFLKLDSMIVEKKSIVERVDTFFEQQEYVNPSLAVKNKVYLGVENCAVCHTDEAKIWKESNHAHAFQTLVNEKRAFDSDCLPCHTTGMFQGGFKTVSETKNFIDVQCESCHSDLPDEHHLAKNRLKRNPVTEENCMSCHTEKNSPNFNYKTYLKKITHWKTQP